MGRQLLGDGGFGRGEDELEGEVGPQHLIVRSVDRGAVVAQGVELAADRLGAADRFQAAAKVAVFVDVAGVGVAGDEAQRDLLAAAADQQRRRLLDRRRRDPQPFDLVVPTVEGEPIRAPGPVDDRQRLLQRGVTFLWRREGDAQGAELRLPPADAEPEDQPAAAEVIEIGGEAGVAWPGGGSRRS